MPIQCSSTMGTSINSKSVPVLAYPTSRSFFQSLPAETRNSIYELILIHDQSIKITSLPRGRKKNAQSNSNFLALTLVNKAIGQEAKTTFYSRNTFIIGNGRYGSPIQVNLHGFRCFIRRVPKECLALIRKIHLYLFFAGFPDYRLPNSKFRMHDLDIKELKTIATAIIKHLKGV
ncbi:uncharacterized protein PAC_16538 [Phialocephala subalpina]|uniref:F-box domain-containing protein n=1 Tax=Phialocephala subalpina TaxID=576137 RepID=A0A1L7XNW1_9HELO|nr:uncharacterized protein PAC_16538 [Phialocephala subalpina]